MDSCKKEHAVNQTRSSVFHIRVTFFYNICLLLFSLRYYQTVPSELPEIPKQQVFGLATPEDFTLPPHHPLWTEEVYAAFNVPEGSGQGEGPTYESKVYIITNDNYTVYTCTCTVANILVYERQS